MGVELGSSDHQSLSQQDHCWAWQRRHCATLLSASLLVLWDLFSRGSYAAQLLAGCNANAPVALRNLPP